MNKDDKITVALETHLRECREIAQRFQSQMAPFRDVQESIRKSIFETRDALQKTLEPLVAHLEQWQQMVESVRLPKIDLPDLSYIAKQAVDFQKAIQESVAPAFHQLQKGFSELPARTQEALLLLGQHGWYLDPEMSLPALWELKNALSEGNVLAAESALVDYFERRLTEIEESLTTKFPHRSHLVRAAFNAHRREEYELSIPVLLAQTDGICKETVDQYLFLKHNKKPRTAIYVDQIAADTYLAALLSPLALPLPIGASENERPAGFAALNRHTVLHGESLDYGSKTNSLKAISLINYVAYVLRSDNP